MTWEGLTPPYSTIVADPPWQLKWSGGAGGTHRRATPLTYSLMDLSNIALLPVQDIAAADAHLFLWITAEQNRRGHGVSVATAWGFATVSEIIWEKPNFGMGVMPRLCHEVLLVCRRGSLAWDGPRDIRSVQKWRQTYDCNSGKRHSAKPVESFDLIERVSPGPYVELFSRTPRLGWDSWGYGWEQTA